MAVALAPYNTVTLAASTATELVIAGGGSYYVQILNLGPGNLYIKRDNTVSATDAASYELPINMSLAPLTRGPLWVLADQAGKISVALTPKP